MKSYLQGLLTSARGGAYLASQYKQMHAIGAFLGQSWRVHLETLRATIPDLEHKRIVDFGCGPCGGLAQEFGANVLPYDPYLNEFSSPPWEEPFDVLFSSDVLEHMTIAEVRKFLHTVRRCSPWYVFISISTRKAYKLLPSGVNAHLTIKPGRWWLSTVHAGLGSEFHPIFAAEDLLRSDCVLCFERRITADKAGHLR